MLQVPVIAKADSMTVDELRQFRKYVRSELEQVTDMHCAFPVLAHVYLRHRMCLVPRCNTLLPEKTYVVLSESRMCIGSPHEHFLWRFDWMEAEQAFTKSAFLVTPFLGALGSTLMTCRHDMTS